MFAFRIRNFIEFLHAIFLIPFILHRSHKIIFFAAPASTSYISPLFLFSMFSVHIKIFSHHPQWAIASSSSSSSLRFGVLFFLSVLDEKLFALHYYRLWTGHIYTTCTYTIIIALWNEEEKEELEANWSLVDK